MAFSKELSISVSNHIMHTLLNLTINKNKIETSDDLIAVFNALDKVSPAIKKLALLSKAIALVQNGSLGEQKNDLTHDVMAEVMDTDNLITELNPLVKYSEPKIQMPYTTYAMIALLSVSVLAAGVYWLKSSKNTTEVLSDASGLQNTRFESESESDDDIDMSTLGSASAPVGADPDAVAHSASFPTVPSDLLVGSVIQQTSLIAASLYGFAIASIVAAALASALVFAVGMSLVPGCAIGAASGVVTGVLTGMHFFHRDAGSPGDGSSQIINYTK